jgi:HD-GYP domain-containing protein (c-di-GMP phosphodiesterase class II)
VRIITILDIFDALIAPDRPYKPAKTVAEALQILQTMAEDEGKLDAELVRQFATSHCWEDGGQEATIVSLIE